METKTKIDIIGHDIETGMYKLTDKGERVTFEMTRGEGERAFRFSLISKQLKWLQKEMLTIAEATIDDHRKLEATKTLIKDKISMKISWIYELCGTPEINERLED